MVPGMACRLGALLAIGLVAAQAPAHGQTFPSKTITIVVPAPPGGVTDTLGRMLALRFAQVWGQQSVVVENKAGANNIIAAEFVAKSPPDGHTP